MNDFNQDMENLLNAYDSNWDDYLLLRKQFIDKYSLSVDKLEDHLLPYSKETVQKIIDEKMQLVTADEFVKLHKESLTAIRENDKLQEQLNTAKKSLAESEKMYQKQMDRFLNSEMNESARSHCESQLKLLKPAHKAYEALAAIGGEDE